MPDEKQENPSPDHSTYDGSTFERLEKLIEDKLSEDSEDKEQREDSGE